MGGTPSLFAGGRRSTHYLGSSFTNARYKSETRDWNRPEEKLVSPSYGKINSLGIMAWIPVILICSAFTASVQAFPGTTREYKAEFYPESLNEYMGQNAQHVQELLAMLVKDKSTHKSPIVEFVYQDQSKNVKAQKGTDREMYMYNQNSIERDHNSKKNVIENIKQSDSKDDFTETFSTNGSNSITSEPLKEINTFLQNHKKQDEGLLFPKELSSITRSQPSYLYDMLPISPFPEEVSIFKEKIVLKKDKLKISRPTFIQRTSQPPQIAGPILYPQSTYSREFDLPFFD